VKEGAPGDGSEPIAAGRYALSEVELGVGGGSDAPSELSLALPFGALFSELFRATPFRVRSLSLEYVAPERLGPVATFSAKVTGIGQGSQAVRLSLLVFRESRVCVRGCACIEILGASIEVLGQHRGPGKVLGDG
jgi:hypothetical protein